MLKKILIGTVVVGLTGGLLFGRHATSYVATTLGWVKESVKESVPVDFEIDRARQLIRDLVPDIRKNMHLIAKEEIEVENLAKQIESQEQRLTKDKVELMRLKTDLSSGQTTFRYANRTYTEGEVKTDLANRFERYKTGDATLASLREMHRAREQSLSAARKKLEGMLASKRQLEVDVEHLEARLKMIEAAKTTSDYQFDDSQLSRAKELVGDLRTRLEVAEKLLHTEGEFQAEIPLDEPVAENLLDEVTDYFQTDEKALVASTPEPAKP